VGGGQGKGTSLKLLGLFEKGMDGKLTGGTGGGRAKCLGEEKEPWTGKKGT